MAGLNQSDVSIQFTTKADNKGTDDAKRGVQNFQSEVEKASKVVNGIWNTALIGATATLGAATAAGYVAIDAYSAQEDALARLQAGINNVKSAHDKSIDSLTEYASKLQLSTRFADEQIESGMAMLTTFQLNQQTIKTLTPGMLDMAEAMRRTSGETVDLNQLGILFGKVMGGASEGIDGMATALRRMGVIMTEEQQAVFKFGTEAERASTIAQIMDLNFKGFAEAGGKTFSGRMDILKNQMGEVQEAFGKIIAEALLPLVQALTPAITKFAEFVSVLASGDLTTARYTLQEMFGQASPIVTFFDFMTANGGTVANALIAIGAALLGMKAAMVGFEVISAVMTAFEGLSAVVAAFSVGGLVEGFGALVALLGGPVLVTVGAVALAIGAVTFAMLEWGPQLLDLVSKNHDLATAQDRVKASQDALKISMDQLRDAEMNTKQATLNVEQANLNVEKAQKAYTKAVVDHGPKSEEARQASINLKQAQLGVEDANHRVSDAVQKEMLKQQEAMKKHKEAEESNENLKRANEGVSSSFDRIANAIQGVIDKFLRWIGLKKDNGNGGGSFATGVMNYGGGVALVGEHGPELVRLPRGSDVVPTSSTNEALAQMGVGNNSGVTVYQENHIYDSVDMNMMLRDLEFTIQNK